MMKHLKIDLHMHSNVSDGTDQPKEMISKVKDAGIGLFSLSDHDDIAGCSEIMKELKNDDPAFICGVEFSCRDELGKYHVLGYGYDPGSPAIKDLVTLGKSYRIDKARQRVNYVEKEFGFILPGQDKEWFFSLPSPGKPHLGNLLVKNGYCKTKEEAIRDYIDGYHAPTQYVTPKEAIEGILKGGGIPVLAHPVYGSGEQLILGEEMESRLRRLMEFGLQGVEAYYSGFSPKMITMMKEFAERFDLYVTAGSDYHGTNKMIGLGDNFLDDIEDGPSGLMRFLRDVRYGKLLL